MLPSCIAFMGLTSLYPKAINFHGKGIHDMVSHNAVLCLSTCLPH